MLQCVYGLDLNSCISWIYDLPAFSRANSLFRHQEVDGQFCKEGHMSHLPDENDHMPAYRAAYSYEHSV